MSRRCGFSLIEVLAAIAILAILAVLAFPTISSFQQKGDQADAISKMRSIGVAINLSSSENSGTMVGPLWPGQVTEYDRTRSGRLVRELAPYLGIEDREPPYVVNQLLPRAAVRALPQVARKDIRPFVMNHLVPVEGTPVSPWGNLAASPPTQPLPSSILSGQGRTWAVSEAYQTHPAVASASWKNNTPPKPQFGKKPLGLFFDGSVSFFDP